MTEPVTFLNMIDIDPSKQAAVIGILTEGVEQVQRGRPGSVSITILASTDGRRVVDLARWAGAEAGRTASTDPRAATFVRRTAELRSAAPGLYTVVADWTA